MSDRAGCEPRLQCSGDSVGAVLDDAIAATPGLGNKIYVAPGVMNRYLRVFVDGTLCAGDVQRQPVGEASEIRLLTALAGG
jgi:hypothetical protein